ATPPPPEGQKQGPPTEGTQSVPPPPPPPPGLGVGGDMKVRIARVLNFPEVQRPWTKEVAKLVEDREAKKKELRELLHKPGFGDPNLEKVVHAIETIDKGIEAATSTGFSVQTIREQDKEWLEGLQAKKEKYQAKLKHWTECLEPAKKKLEQAKKK